MPSASDLDVVSIDGHGTLLELADPAEPLRRALADCGVTRDRGAVAAAFRAEAGYYRPRSLEGFDEASLLDLRVRCVQVFLDAAEADLEAEAFVPAFLDAISFELAEGARAALDELSAAGLTLVCVANWDVSLHEHLRRLGVVSRFALVLPSAEAGAEKPDPAIFRIALERVDGEPSRALHIGDDDVDRLGAAAAGLHFEPVPLATLPERLGLC